MNTLSRLLVHGLAAAAPIVPAHAAAEPVPAIVVVRVAKPWYAPRSAVIGKMRDTVPQYASLPGLAFKAFSFERASGDYGGLYLWRDTAAAQAWFNPAWFERVRAERGVEARVAFFEAPLTVDNVPGGTQADDDSRAVATLVLMRTPAGVSRERLNAEFSQAAPGYRTIPGLMRKHFLVGDGGASFGGLYLWRDEASAKAWFTSAWHERVRKSYGQEAAIDWFDVPILLPTREAANAVPASAMMVAAP